MTFVVMMHRYSPGEYLIGATLVHHADPSGVYQHCRVGMMLECSTGELLARATFKHHDDQGDNALRFYAILNGLWLHNSRLCHNQWCLTVNLGGIVFVC